MKQIAYVEGRPIDCGDVDEVVIRVRQGESEWFYAVDDLTLYPDKSEFKGRLSYRGNIREMQFGA